MCVRAYMRACMRVCVCACACVCAHACVNVSESVCVLDREGSTAFASRALIVSSPDGRVFLTCFSVCDLFPRIPFVTF